MALSACTSVYQTDNQYYDRADFSSLYDPAASDLHPKAMVYHGSDDSSLLFIQLPVNELMQDPTVENGADANASLTVKMAVRNQKTGALADSAILNYTINKKNGGDFITYISMHLPPGNTYLASVIIVDDIKQDYKRLLLDFYKDNRMCRENFFLEKQGENKAPLFTNRVYENTSYVMLSNRYSGDSIWVRYFPCDTFLPVPPYSTQKYENTAFYFPDSVYRIALGDRITFDNKGYYHLTTDTSNYSSGFVLLNQNSFFPLVKTVKQMAEPIVYLTTLKRHDKLMAATDMKKAVDAFWVNLGGNTSRAAELIRVYYNRVQLANRYFTTHKTGWMTDRGMVFVMMGVPGQIFKDAQNEVWVYGTKTDISGLIFRFEKDTTVPQPHSYRLLRSAEYKKAWGQAINTWQSGNAYSVSK